jgi:DNA-binding response OmpR family regulator
MENRKIRILLAEDDENLGLLLKEYLQAKEYEVDLYKDGEKAYKGFQNNYYDICILDVMMPVKDASRWRARSAWPRARCPSCS